MLELKDWKYVSSDQKESIELMKILEEAEKDVRNGRVAPMRDTFEELRAILQEG